VLLALLPNLPRRPAFGAVAGLIAVDLLWATPGFRLEKYSPQEDERFRLLVELRADNDSPESLWRLDASSSQIPANLCLGAGVENINGYWPFAMGRFYRFVHRMRGHEPSALDRHQFDELIYDNENLFPLRIMNVRYAFEEDEVSKAFVVTENEERLPRAWLVERFEVLAEEEAAIERLRRRSFDPARVAILERDPGVALRPADSPIGTCVVRKLDGGGLDIEANAARPALLVMSEIFYPGWRARVDGQVVPLMRADDVISAICLPAGEHHITLRYEPTSFKLGCVATGLCVLAALALPLIGRRWGAKD